MSDEARRRWVEKNKCKPCSTDGCNNRRAYTYARCWACVSKLRRNGTAEGGYIHDSKFKPWRKHAALILDQFADSPQIQAAVEAADVLLREPETFTAQAASRTLWQKNVPIPAMNWRRVGHHIRRVVADGLTGRELLDRIAGVWLFSYHDRKALPDNDRLSHALAETILGSRPYRKRISLSKKSPKRPGRPVMLGLGVAIRKRFGLFLDGMTQYMNRQHTKTWQQAEAMRKPLNDDERDKT